MMVKEYLIHILFIHLFTIILKKTHLYITFKLAMYSSVTASDCKRDGYRFKLIIFKLFLIPRSVKQRTALSPATQYAISRNVAGSGDRSAITELLWEKYKSINYYCYIRITLLLFNTLIVNMKNILSLSKISYY